MAAAPRRRKNRLTALATASSARSLVLRTSVITSAVTEVLVPLMATLYILVALFVVAVNITEVPAMFAHIVGHALGFKEVAGAGIGAYMDEQERDLRARTAGTDVLLIDTAGRLQNKAGLMDELSKIRRVLGRLNPQAVLQAVIEIADRDAGHVMVSHQHYGGTPALPGGTARADSGHADLRHARTG